MWNVDWKSTQKHQWHSSDQFCGSRKIMKITDLMWLFSSVIFHRNKITKTIKKKKELLTKKNTVGHFVFNSIKLNL